MKANASAGDDRHEEYQDATGGQTSAEPLFRDRGRYLYFLHKQQRISQNATKYKFFGRSQVSELAKTTGISFPGTLSLSLELLYLRSSS